MPTNTDALTILQGKIIPDNPSEDAVIVNELYVKLQMEQNTPTWYLGHFITRIPDDTVKIEHFYLASRESNLKWKNQTVPHTADIKTENIIVCKIVSQWHVNNKQMLTYTLNNHEDVDRLVHR